MDERDLSSPSGIPRFKEGRSFRLSLFCFPFYKPQSYG
nr:MAG TPA: hypothetical protein [Caudoviricetes sp.]